MLGEKKFPSESNIEGYDSGDIKNYHWEALEIQALKIIENYQNLTKCLEKKKREEVTGKKWVLEL